MSSETTGQRAKARVMLVDDHPIVRQGLANLIEQEPDLSVCAQVADAASALQVMSEASPDVVLVDISLTDRSGLDLIKDIRAKYPKVVSLVLSMHDELLYAERALRAGAMGYVMKQEATENVMEALRRVLAGKTYLSRNMSSRLSSAATHATDTGKRQNPLSRLSDRELEVFSMIGHGLGTREIAGKLSLSIKTVEAHREHIKEKLNLKNGTELMRYAVQYTLEDAPGTRS